MVGIIKEIDGQKKIVPLTTDTGTGAPIGTLITQYKKVPMSGYLYCDGSTFDENDYPALYMYLGTNVLPDYRECVMVGAEQNTTDTIATHDVYGEGEFKDDQIQRITGSFEIADRSRSPETSGVFSVSKSDKSWFALDTTATNSSLVSFDSSNVARTGDTNTTHGKQKAVYVYIKATSGLAENQQENVLNDVKGYVDTKIGEHNGIFRGKCLNGNPATMYPILPIGNTKSLPGGGYTIEQVMANIAAGNFDDIFIGDYFIDSENKVYRIAGLDTELNKGDTPLTSHHAIIVTDFALTNMGWNPTNTTAGGYKSSAIQAYCDGAGQTAIEGVFGAAHVLTVSELLSSDMNASAASPGYSAFKGAASAWEWFSHKVRLMNEVEVCGTRVWSGGYDIGTANEQLPLFRLMPQLATGLHYNYWLSGIANATLACYVNYYGYAGGSSASAPFGVRVRFLVG